MRTIKIVYLTLIHVIAFGSIFLYTNDNYALVKYEKAQNDTFSAYLDDQEKKHK